MSILAEFRRENNGVSRIIETASLDPDVQGVTVEMNIIWIYLWRLYETYGRRWLSDRFSFYRYYPRGFGFYTSGALEKHVYDLAIMYLKTDSWLPMRELSLSAFYNFYDDFLLEIRDKKMEADSGKPFEIRICLYPGTRRPGQDLSESDERNFRVVYEPRPISYLHHASRRVYSPVRGGTSISVEDHGFGTLGGILQHTETGKYYGVTCSHVAGDNTDVFHPAKCDSRLAAKVGNVVAASQMQRLSVASYELKGLSEANEVDIALIELSAPAAMEILKIGKLRGVFPGDQIVPHGRVEFVGRSSGYKRFLYINADVIFFDLHHAGYRYRCKNLMQVMKDGMFTNQLSRPTRPGDSGAWLCAPVSGGMAWCGMVIGGDGQMGYAIPAERIMQWIQRDAKMELSLVAPDFYDSVVSSLGR